MGNTAASHSARQGHFDRRLGSGGVPKEALVIAAEPIRSI